LREALAKAGIYPHIEPGEVWKAKDSAIWLVGALTRHFHKERYCVILSNRQMCSDNEWPLVLVAPLSHKLYPVARPDLLIDSTDKNGLAVPSRMILSQIQPLDKAALQERVGEIGASKWEQVVRQIFWHVKRA
jgi:mRNA-degrading endonuclease toxin of MazEF toxin-antitoxin module